MFMQGMRALIPEPRIQLINIHRDQVYTEVVHVGRNSAFTYQYPSCKGRGDVSAATNKHGKFHAPQ